MTRSLLALLLVAVLSSGCATKAPAPTPVPAPDVPADAPAVYSLDIQVEDDYRDNRLLKLLQENLDIARYRASEAALSRVELARLAAAAPAQAATLLETLGYFSATATVERKADDDSRVRLLVKPGPRTRVTKIDLEFTEGLAADDAKPLRDSLRKAWSLEEGDPFTQGYWSSAKNDLLLQARTGGFPLARWGETSARVDADKQTAELHLVLASGNRARFGTLNIEGLNRQSRQTVERLTGFRHGDAYTARARRRGAAAVRERHGGCLRQDDRRDDRSRGAARTGGRTRAREHRRARGASAFPGREGSARRLRRRQRWNAG